jgi:drug/metabolite transporter (DMT)-like permease
MGMQERTPAAEGRSLASRGFANAYLLLILTMIFWAGNSVVARGMHATVPPLALAWVRWTLAFFLILPFAVPHLRRDWRVIRATWPTLLMLGAVGAGTFIALYYYGISKTSAINALVINSAVPILIPVAAFMMYREQINRFQAFGIGVSLIGVLIVLFKGDAGVLLAADLNQGDIWVLLAMGVWAVYTVLLRKQPPIHWLSFAAISFATASMINLPLFIGEHLLFRQIHWSPEAVIAVLYVATLPSATAQIFYIRSVELIGASRAGVFIHLVPMFGAIMAILFLGEILHLYHLAGFALILCGIWLASRPERGDLPVS